MNHVLCFALWSLPGLHMQKGSVFCKKWTDFPNSKNEGGVFYKGGFYSDSF